MKLVSKHILIFFAVHLCSISLFCQANTEKFIKGTVIDNESLLPVSDVHVFVLNSTLVTITDAEGNFQFEANDIRAKDLLLTHLSYEASNIFIELEQTHIDTIFISPKSVQLEDVIVKSKKSKVKKARLKRFTRDVFGKRRRSKHITILNDQDILFQEKNDSLVAYGNNLIDVENRYLGYNLKFLLEDYVHSKEDINYNGKIFFEDLMSSDKSIKSKRDELWESSQHAFLMSLLTNSHSDQGFKCSKAMIAISAMRQEYEEISKDVVYTNIDGVYAIILPAVLIVKSKKGVSQIVAENNLLIFNSSGEIINKDEVNILGYWGKLSITESMPSNYRPSVEVPSLASDRTYSIGELRAKIDNKNKTISKQQPLEKIELIIDKEFYLSNEIIYISASHLDINLNELVEDQQLIYFEVYNHDKNQLIKRKCALTIGGKASQSFAINAKYLSGQYSIVAYTDYMKNFSTTHFGKASFTVNLKHDKINETKYVEWHPEGGNLIPNQVNRVVFKVTDAHGKPAELDDYITDKSTGELIKTKTLFSGLGTTQITPNDDSFFEFESQDDIKIINTLKPTGTASLSVINTDKTFVSIKINSVDSISDQKINVYQNGNEVFTMKDLSNNQLYKINKDFLPNSMLTFNLADGLGNTVSTRQFSNESNYNRAIKVSPNFAYYYGKQKGIIDIAIDQSILPDSEELDWTISLRHIDKIAKKPIILSTDGALDLAAVKYLGDLKAIASSNDSEHIKYNLPNSSNTKYSRELKMKLKGSLSDPESNLPIIGQVSVSSLAKDFYFDELQTNKKGEFYFENLPFRPDASYIIQARRKEDNKSDSKFENRNVTIKFDSLYSQINIDSINYIPIYKNEPQTDWVVDTTKVLEDFQMSGVIDEITIKAKSEKEGLTSLTSINGREWHNPTARMKNVMSAFFPTMELRKDPINPTFRLIKVRGGADSYVYVKFYMDIDGFATRNIDYLERYIAEDIAYIGLGGSTLVIRTSPMARYKRIVAERSKGVTVFTYDHLLDKTTYNVEDPNKKAVVEDTRTTLYWNPNYKISDDSKIEFYTSDVPGDYILTMTGYHPEAGKIELHKKISVVSKAQ